MPSRLDTAVLTVNAHKMHKVDTSNAENLHGMWMVFSKCAEYMEEGRRLENLSWRLWNRETFCVEPQIESLGSPVIDAPHKTKPESSGMPELSSSVESAASEPERIERHIKSKPMDVKPTIVGEDAGMSISRGKEKHITSMRLERMVFNIKQRKNLEPFAHAAGSPVMPLVDVTPRPSSPPVSTPAMTQSSPQPPPQLQPQPQPQPQRIQALTRESSESCSTAALAANDSDHRPAAGSDTSVSSNGLMASPSVVRGFSPSQISSSYRSNTRLAVDTPSARNSPQSKAAPIKRKGGMFTLGGSSGDDESSFEERMTTTNQPPPRSSCLSDSLNQSSPSKKVASFQKDVESRTIKPIKERAHEDEDAIETDDDEEVSESAIDDDDDSSDWEDSVTESGRSSVDDKELFQRVDSRPNLVSRPSLLTMMMHQPQRMTVQPPGTTNGVARSSPALQRSRTSPNGPSLAVSPEEDDDDENTLTMRGPDVPRSKPILAKPSPAHQAAHSPRTTRRNMLATELTESLRRHLLWERQQKNTTANAVFKRRHTAHDMANLQEYPKPQGAQQRKAQSGQGGNVEAGPSKDKETPNKGNSWNHYFDYGPWEYHVKGW